MAGVKLFLSGEVAYAADVNTFLMDQVIAVFDDNTERNAAFGDGIPVGSGGSGKPLLTEGRFCYNKAVGEIQYYDGTQWQTSGQFSIEDDAITTSKILNLAVTTAKINDLAITEGKIAATAVTEGKIGAGAVTEAKIGTGAVTETKIGSNAVTTAKINDSAVTEGKIASGSVSETKIGSGAVTVDKIGTSAVTEAKINTGAVTESKIGASSVTEAKIGTGAVTSDKLGANVVTDAKIRQSSARSIIGNSTNATANIADITSSTDGAVLRQSGTTLGFGLITDSNIDSSASIASTKLGPISQTTRTQGESLSASYANKIVTYTSSTADTNVQLPHSDINYPIGTAITFVVLGTGMMTFTSDGTSVIRTPISGATKTRAQYSTVTAIKIASETWLLAGDLGT